MDTRQNQGVAIEWGCLMNLMDKIGNIEDNIEGGWIELADMVAEAMDREWNEHKEDTEAMFFLLYEFLWRLYYRLKTNPSKRKFNIVREHTISNGEEGFAIYNYNYDTYRWARDGGLLDTISNDFIYVPSDKLTPKQRKTMEKRCEEKGGMC